MKLILDVTQADIDAAAAARKRRIAASGARTPGLSCRDCPLANALRRLYPQAGWVRVNGDSLSVGDEFGYTLCWAPHTQATQRFITGWDRRWKAAPRRFHLTAE